MTCLESTRKFPYKNSQIDFIVAANHKDSCVCPKGGSTRIGIYNQKYNHSFLYCNNCKGNNIVMADKFSKYNISVKENECNFACMKTGHALACSQGNRIHTDGIECFWAMLKRGVHGVFHNPPVEHIQKYTAESCCRLDHRDNNEDFTSSVGLSITQQHDCQYFTNGGGKSENTAGELSPESRGIGTHNRKSLILSHCGFRSKTGAGYKCYSGFFRDSSAEDFAIITEAKADDSNASCEEAKPCILDNAIVKDITAIPISGKSNNPYRSSLFFSNRDYTGSMPHKNSDGRLCRAKSGRCGFRHLHGKPHYGAGGKLDCPSQRQ